MYEMTAAVTFTAWGALAGLILAVVLILLKVTPAYGLIAGALAGGLIGCLGSGIAPGMMLSGTVDAMIAGAADMMPSVVRILASGILAGALMETGAAERIADGMVRLLGKKRAVFAVALSSAVICAVGVFADIAVITAAPIALLVGRQAGISKPGMLLAMIGGVKAGNILSPNPNTIAAAEAFGIDMTALMLENAVPALLALAVTVWIASHLGKSGSPCALPAEETRKEKSADGKPMPGIVSSVCGPLLVLVLLSLRPIAGIGIDPLIALPAGGLLCILATKNARRLPAILASGIEKVTGVAVLLIGTGALAGIIRASSLQTDMVRVLETFRLPAFLLAPISGIFMAAATASTTAGATIASETFAPVLTGAGVRAASAAAMVHAGATVFDSLPHGSFFHATGGAVFMDTRERMRLLVWEALVGLTSTAAAVGMYFLTA